MVLVAVDGKAAGLLGVADTVKPTAREAIAKRISALTPDVKDDMTAQVVLHLAQAYSALAAEPPRPRGD